MSLKFGIRGHDLVTKSNVDELVKKMKEHDLKYLQLVFPKTFADYSYDSSYVNNVLNKLNEAGIQVKMLGAYFNPVHSDKKVVDSGVNNFISNLDISHLFNACVGSETGSYNDSPWTYVPKNHTEEGYQETLSIFKKLVEHADKIEANISVEAAWGHVIYSPDCLSRFVKDLNSPDVFVTIDLFNLLYPGNFEDRDYIFEKALTTFKDKIKIIHLKDGKIVDGKLVQCAPGKGDFHYSFMIQEIFKYCPDATLIFEGVKEDDIDESYSALKTIEKNFSL